jgi:hypothetical protein
MPRARSVQSRRRRIRAVDIAVYTAAPVSASRPPYLAPPTALTLSHVPVARCRGADVHAAVPPDAAVYAVVPHRRPRFGEPRHVFPGRLPSVGEAPP